MEDEHEINYAGVIYKNGSKIKFTDEDDKEQIGILRFGLYHTHWLDSGKMILHKNEHVGWIIDYNIEENSYEQKTLGDVIMDFGGFLIEE